MKKSIISFLMVGFLWIPLEGFAAAVSDRIDAQDGAYKVLGWELPDKVCPGQQVHGKVKLLVIDPGKVVYTHPYARFISRVDDQKSFALSGRKMMPWILTSDQKAGDTLSVGFILDVPMDFPLGQAEFCLMNTRQRPDGMWEFAKVQDGTGKAVKERKDFTIALTVVSGNDSEEAVSLPVVVRPMSKPVLDGRIDPGEWKSAGIIESFEKYGNEPTTRLYLGYDQQNIYLAFVCDKGKSAKTTKVKMDGRDPRIFDSNDTVCAYLNPKAVSLIFATDLLNQHYDASGTDFWGFNQPWKSAVSEKGASWTVEMEIPFASLECHMPRPGDLWQAGFVRVFPQMQKQSGWPKADGKCPLPGELGKLVFGSIRPYLEKSFDDLKDFKTEVPSEMAKEMEAWRVQLDSLHKHISALKDETNGKDLRSMIAGIEALKKEKVSLEMKAWRLASKGLIVAKTHPYELFTGKMMDDDVPAGPVGLTMLQDEWMDLAWNFTNTTDQEMTVRCAALEGAKAEGTYDYLRMSLSGLEAKWAEAIPVTPGRNDQLPIGRLAWDAIIPNVAGVIHLAPKATAQVWLTLHIPANAPAGLRNIHAVIEPLDSSNWQPITIPISIKVLPVQITAKRYFNLFTWNLVTPEVSADRAWYEAHLDDLAQHGVNVLLLHSLHMFPRPKANADGTLIGPLDFSRVDLALDLARGRFDTYYFTMDIWEKGNVRNDLFGLKYTDPNYEKAFKTWLRLVLKHLKSKGVTNENMLINPVDESTEAQSSQQIAKWIKEVDPTCRIVIDCSSKNVDEAQAMNRLTDVWVPHYRDFFPDEFQPFHKMIRDSKKPYWFYFYSEGAYEKNQDPTLHYLAKFWWAYRMNLTGMGYWANQYYGDPWYRKSTKLPYDTMLIYPIPEGVVDSRRWQAWRRGWEDYNLMSILRDKLTQTGDQETLKTLNARIQDVVANPGNQAKLETTREWIKSRL